MTLATVSALVRVISFSFCGIFPGGATTSEPKGDLPIIGSLDPRSCPYLPARSDVSLYATLEHMLAVKTLYGSARMQRAYLLLRHKRDGTAGTPGASLPQPPGSMRRHDSVGSLLLWAGWSNWWTGPDRPRGKRNARPRDHLEQADASSPTHGTRS